MSSDIPLHGYQTIHWPLSRYFSVYEAVGGDAWRVPLEIAKGAVRLAQHLDVIRGLLGQPLYVTSWIRSPEHNRLVGGSEHSLHLRGLAADITTEGHTSDQLADVIEQLIARGDLPDGGLGRYPRRGHVHYDLGPPGRRWTRHG